MVDEISDFESAVLVDLLENPRAILKAHKKAVLSQLLAKGFIEPTKNEPEIYQLTKKASHFLAERGVGISGG